MRSSIFGGSSGDRSDVNNVAVVLTDGKSTIDESQTMPAASMQNILVGDKRKLANQHCLINLLASTRFVYLHASLQYTITV